MRSTKPAKKSAKMAAFDRGEPIGRMEPLLVSQSERQGGALADRAVELASKAAGFRRSLPPGIMSALADMVRATNCYYSNLIEGHDTHPIEIERALRNDFSNDARKRNLQIEAKAHIAVQRWIDEGGTKGKAVSADSVREIHKRFCELLPDEFLWVEDKTAGEKIRVAPGELRNRDVAVGRHVAVSPGAVPRFLKRFEEVYGRLGKADTIVATAAAHHRLLWIHPFLDGNGRVARLMSHAILLDALDTGGVWSVARGLARNVAAYKSRLANCDLRRRNDLDGRGNLSEEALADFTRFFLDTCIDQVSFMESLMQPDRLRARILLWVEEEIRLGNLPPKAGRILEAVLYRGEIPRGDIPSLVGLPERTARRALSALGEKNILVSDSPKGPVRLAFPAALAARWMPGLFPEK